jgi:hypothetical protein
MGADVEQHDDKEQPGVHTIHLMCYDWNLTNMDD